jgi:glucosamine-6-phosphate deaminase
MDVIIKKNYEEICDEAVQIIHESWEKKKNLVLGFATGRTPLGVYQRLIELNKKEEMDFLRIITFNLDEYLGLDESHPQSFAYYMDKNLLRHVNIRRENIFRLNGKPHDIEKHCQEYEEKIRAVGGIDLQLLGVGRNGHIGFNEPGSSLTSRTRVKALTQNTIEANASLFKRKEAVPRHCLTIGIGTILDAKQILLLASGKEKCYAIKGCVEGPITASVPASALQLHPQTKIIVDEEAAWLLDRKDYYKWDYENKLKF